jgi:cob(I)alamin adenosyltransferase
VARIYTKTGDGGDTRLFDGTRVRKSHARVGAYGDVDELNATLGLARAALDGAARDALEPVLDHLQRELFAVGALLADPRRDGEAAPPADSRLALGEAEVLRLEGWIDAWQAELPPLGAFILPAGTAAAAALHLARTVARRAERAAVDLVAGGGGTPVVVRYLNRLSDLLFVAARLANARSGVEDTRW